MISAVLMMMTITMMNSAALMTMILIMMMMISGYKLPENVVAVPDLLEAAKDADVLIFVIPHQFLPRLCSQLKVITC